MGSHLLPKAKESHWVARALAKDGDALLIPDGSALEDIQSHGPSNEPIVPFTLNWLSDEAAVSVMLGSFRGRPDVAALIDVKSTPVAPDFISLHKCHSAGFVFTEDTRTEQGSQTNTSVRTHNT